MTILNQRLYHFEAVPGIFAQSLPETDPATFDYTKGCMGLLSAGADIAGAGHEEKPWTQLMRRIEALQAHAPEGTKYKLIINGRHGEGYHNVAESRYGTTEWDAHWSKLEGDGDAHWADSHLTAIGQQQAVEARNTIDAQMKDHGLPAPQSYIVSPLYRCLETAYLTFDSLRLPADRPFRPVIKEMIREVLGEHTCDRRSTKAEYEKAFPSASFEPGFADEDLLWRADHRETHDEHDIRTQALLDDVFEHDPGTVISFTSHSGSIASLLRVCKHRVFRLQTGAMIPLLIKAVPRSK